MTTPNTETQKLKDDRRAAEAHAAKHGGPDGSISSWEVEAFLAGIAHARQQPAPPSRERRSKEWVGVSFMDGRWQDTCSCPFYFG